MIQRVALVVSWPLSLLCGDCSDLVVVFLGFFSGFLWRADAHTDLLHVSGGKGRAFSDDNKDWLRPRGDAIFDDEEDDDDDDDLPDDEFDLGGSLPHLAHSRSLH